MLKPRIFTLFWRVRLRRSSKGKSFVSVREKLPSSRPVSDTKPVIAAIRSPECSRSTLPRVRIFTLLMIQKTNSANNLSGRILAQRSKRRQGDIDYHFERRGKSFSDPSHSLGMMTLGQ